MGIASQSIKPIDLQQMLDSIEELPTIPETLVQVLKVADDPMSCSSDLAEILQYDAPLTAKILKLANSSYYSNQTMIANVVSSISLLGYRTIRQVAICVTVSSTLTKAVSKARGRLDYKELWKHSVTTAAITKYLASVAGYPHGDEIFTAGLLHDLGKFLLEIHAPETYSQVIQERNEKHEPLAMVEKRYFGFDHAEIGAAFGQSWNFPSEITSCIGGHHHELMAGGQKSDESKAIALVALGDYLANTIKPPKSDLGFDPRNVNAVAIHEAAGMDFQIVDENMDEIQEAISQSSAFLDLSP